MDSTRMPVSLIVANKLHDITHLTSEIRELLNTRAMGEGERVFFDRELFRIDSSAGRLVAAISENPVEYYRS